MDDKLGYKFLEKDVKGGVLYRPLDFQYKSYENFILYRLREILECKREIINLKKGQEKIFLEISKVKIEPPKYSASSAITWGKSYEASVTFNINITKETITINGVVTTDIASYAGSDFQLIKVPLMVTYGGRNSLEKNNPICPNSVGGVFINKLAIEKVGINLVDKITTWPKFKSLGPIKPTIFTFSFSSISLKDDPVYKYKHYKIYLDLLSPENITISSSKTFNNLNIILLIQFLTRMSLDEILEYITFDVPETSKTLGKMIIESIRILENPNPKDHIMVILRMEFEKVRAQYEKESKTFKDFSIEILCNILPHMKNSSTIMQGFYLLSLVRKFIITIFFSKRYPDRDSLVCHRVLTYGSYFEELTKDELENYISSITKDLKNNIENRKIYSVNPQILTTPGFNQAFSALLGGKFKKTDGSFRSHTHYSWIQSVSIPRSVGYYPDQVKISKMFSVRRYHPSQYGFLCAADIPERGNQVGLISQLSIHTAITDILPSNFKKLREEITSYLETKYKNYLDYRSGIIVTIENIVIMSVSKNMANNLVEDLRSLKRLNAFGNNEFSVIYIADHLNEIRINFGSGRLIRPLMVVTDGKLNLFKKPEIIDGIEHNIDKDMDILSFSEILQKYPHVVEFIDIEQSTFSNICNSVNEFNALDDEIKKKMNYCDFNSNFRDGYVSSCLTGNNHNAGPRSILGCAQTKQAISCLTSDLRNKIDNGISLIFPERPVIISKCLEMSKIADNCFGQHVIIALMSFKGKNQEDGIIFKKEFIDRGGIDIVTMKKITQEVPYENFNNTEVIKSNAYGKLGSDGIVKLNAFIENGDAIIKNISTRRIDSDIVKDNFITFDISETYSDIYPTRIERVKIDIAEKVKIRALAITERRPVYGDKFTSRTSQKGTITSILPECELPYNKDGVRPDIIVNSTAIFSRKTISMLLEIIMTTAYAKKPYNEKGENRPICINSSNLVNFSDFIDFAEKCHRHADPDIPESEIQDRVYCQETLYNPETDEPYPSKIVFGPIYYMRLRHLTLDKANVRCRGKKTKLIKQANEGRKKGGGIKFGEMERDCLIAHGSANSIKEVLNDNEEDRRATLVCGECGDILPIKKHDFITCIRCSKMGLTPQLNNIILNHVTKVFLTQTAARGIKTKLGVDQLDIKFKD